MLILAAVAFAGGRSPDQSQRVVARRARSSPPRRSRRGDYSVRGPGPGQAPRARPRPRPRLQRDGRPARDERGPAPDAARRRRPRAAHAARGRPGQRRGDPRRRPRARPRGTSSRSSTRPASSTRLVDDLRTITQSEAGRLALHREPTDPRRPRDRRGPGRSRRPRRPRASRLKIEVPDDLPITRGRPGPDSRGRREPRRERDPPHAARRDGHRSAARGRGRRRGAATSRSRSPTPAPGSTRPLLPHVFDRFAKSADSRGSGWGWRSPAGSSRPTAGRSRPSSRAGGGATFRFSLPVDPPGLRGSLPPAGAPDRQGCARAPPPVTLRRWQDAAVAAPPVHSPPTRRRQLFSADAARRDRQAGVRGQLPAEGSRCYHTYAEMAAEIHAVAAAHPVDRRGLLDRQELPGPRAVGGEDQRQRRDGRGRSPRSSFDALHHAREHFDGRAGALPSSTSLADNSRHERDDHEPREHRARSTSSSCVNPDGGEYDLTCGRVHAPYCALAQEPPAQTAAAARPAPT